VVPVDDRELTGSQEVRGFESLRLHRKSPGRDADIKSAAPVPQPLATILATQPLLGRAPCNHRATPAILDYTGDLRLVSPSLR
jgi:hypothetical protein